MYLSGCPFLARGLGVEEECFVDLMMAIRLCETGTLYMDVLPNLILLSSVDQSLKFGNYFAIAFLLYYALLYPYPL